jgi:hypothetical protein
MNGASVDAASAARTGITSSASIIKRQ